MNSTIKGFISFYLLWKEHCWSAFSNGTSAGMAVINKAHKPKNARLNRNTKKLEKNASIPLEEAQSQNNQSETKHSLFSAKNNTNKQNLLRM